MKNIDTAKSLPVAGYIRQADLIPGIIPISSPTLWRWVKTKKFPAPIKLGPSVTAWSVEEIRKWVDSKTSQRQSI